MSKYRKGDWVKYQANGYWITKKVLEVRPDGQLVTGDHDHDSDNHIIDPSYHGEMKKIRK